MPEYQDYLNRLIEKAKFPGISLLFAQEDKTVLDIFEGKKSLFPESQELHSQTLYDMASLTKPLVTALLTLYFIDKKRLSLKTPVTQFFPQLQNLSGVTLQHLLTHTSGLPNWYPFYLFGQDYLSQFSQLQLDAKPGKRVEYSCVGYILLFYILQQVGKSSFQQLAREILFQPLKLTRTFLNVPADLRNQAAPTEMGDNLEQQKALGWARKKSNRRYLPAIEQFPWRKTVIQGEAHDLLSHYQDGTAGNAGLFSTTFETYQLARQFFPQYTTLISPQTLELCWTNFTPRKKSHRTIGFKRNSSFFTSGGRAFSSDAIGHNGFTGPSIWLDRQNKNTVVILLTNILHPHLRKHNYDRIRRKLHTLLLHYLGKEKSLFEKSSAKTSI